MAGALDGFRQIQERQRDYQDVSARIETIRRAIDREKPRLRLGSLPTGPLWEAVPHGQVVPRPDGSWAPWHCWSG